MLNSNSGLGSFIFTLLSSYLSDRVYSLVSCTIKYVNMVEVKRMFIQPFL